MAATKLHSSTQIESVHDLTEAQRIHLRQALCAAGPQPHLEEFEFLALQHSFGSEELAQVMRHVCLLRARFFDSKNQRQENVRSIALKAKRKRMILLLEQQQTAVSMARKFVAELVDKGLIVEKGGFFCPNIPVEHVKLHAASQV
jgi:hypothetical protein